MDFVTNYLPLSGVRNASFENATANMIEVSADKTATSIASTWIHYAATNRSQHFRDLMRKDFVFDRTDVRVMFISLYSLVFCCCFCGMCFILINKYSEFIHFIAYLRWLHLNPRATRIYIPSVPNPNSMHAIVNERRKCNGARD